MKTILFEFRWNNIGSWNGKTAGQDKKYYIRRQVSKEQDPESKLDDGYFIYDFGDGWTAGVSSKRVSAREAQKAMRQSAGFHGCDWMVDEILKHGRILTRDERRAVESEERKREAEKRAAQEREYQRYERLYKDGVMCPRCEHMGFARHGKNGAEVVCSMCGYTIIGSQPAYDSAEMDKLIERWEVMLYGRQNKRP